MLLYGKIVIIFLQLGKGNKNIKWYLSFWPENNLETNMIS